MEFDESRRRDLMTFTTWRRSLGILALAGILAAAMTGCTSTEEGPAGPTASASADPNPSPDDGDESQDQWAHLKTLVLAKYSDAEYASVGSSAQRTSFHISPAESSGTTGLAVAVSCSGGGGWTVRIDQQNPRTVRGSCDDPAVVDAAVLDDHPTGVRFTVSPPKGIRFWIVTFYTKD